MILVDTSIWIDHLRNSLNPLIKELDAGRVLCHPYIIGELACGNIENRSEILKLLKALPEAQTVDDSSVLDFIEDNHLYARGLGWVDLHLLVSSVVTSCRLWTKDKRLHTAAKEFEVSK